ncbi:MAG: Rieske 2Fe-2S domain-containing protein [Pseudomonadota bacterium]
MLTEIEREKTETRSDVIDYNRIEGLHYLGNYVRRLPTNMARMMENAYDWEHLPYVHPSSFASIDLVDSGDWGWRAKLGVPGGIEPTHQMLDLIVDAQRNYWVSTVYHGPGEGIEIHTQATTLSEDEIEVDVRFYLPEAPADEATGAVILQYMQSQYKTLYDEDIDLMSGRQTALEDRSRWRKDRAEPSDIKVAAVTELDPEQTLTIETDSGRYCLRHFQERWHVHSAVCPHLLGPLQDSALDADGYLTCPWHGYQFSIVTGESKDGQCQALATAPELIERDGHLFLRETKAR